uniref:CCHC-type domain-containing protein n=1 Tax=Haemonchus contortus TaxID=6289 RepID=A0A7I4XW25_HAECO
MSRTQRPGQTLQDYYAKLQKAAATCEFEKIKDHRDAMVTMVFIRGLASVDTRKRPLERENLTSKEALEAGEAFERVGKNAPHLKQGLQEVSISLVQAIKEKLSQKPRQNLPSSRVRPLSGKNSVKEQPRNILKGSNNRSAVLVQCTCCGGHGHAAYQCFKRQTSFWTVCSRPGHMARACRTRKANTRKVSRRIYLCAEPSTSDLDEAHSSENNIDRLTHKARQGRREEKEKSEYQREVSKTAQNQLIRRSEEMRGSRDRLSGRMVKVEPAEDKNSGY